MTHAEWTAWHLDTFIETPNDEFNRTYQRLAEKNYDDNAVAFVLQIQRAAWKPGSPDPFHFLQEMFG